MTAGTIIIMKGIREDAYRLFIGCQSGCTDTGFRASTGIHKIATNMTPLIPHNTYNTQ